MTGLRVIDLTGRIAGPYCAKLLADYGADVVKIERPVTGDPARLVGPFYKDEQDIEGSLLFHYLNTNKRSVVLDLKSVADRKIALALVSAADVVVESFRPGTLERLGLGYEVLRQANPNIVLTSISNFGQSGPNRDVAASELVLYAMGGIMAISGSTEREPLKHGLSQAQYGAGVTAAYATVAGVLHRDAGSGGSWIDVSIQETLASELVLNEAIYAWNGGIQGRRPESGDGLNNMVRCKDGYVVIQVTKPAMWTAFVDLVGSPEIADERFASAEGRALNSRELGGLIAAAFERMSKDEIFDGAAERRILAGVAQGPDDLLGCPQLAARNYFVDVDHPSTGILPHPGAPLRMSETPWMLRRRAPLLGEHTREVIDEVSVAASGSSQSIGNGVRGTVQPIPVPDAARRPLEGIRVIDTSSVFAMPYLAAVLADLGAEVIKIEPLHRLDQARGNLYFTALPDNEPGDRPWDRSGVFANLNRGKRSLALDLTKPQGRDAFRRLVAISDIVVENNTPPVMRKWDLDYENLAAIRPEIIMISNTGYGHNGPWTDYPIQGMALEPMTGMCHYTGYRNGPPGIAGQSYPDFVATWHGLLAVLAALRHRRRSGRGQWIDLGMYQASVGMLGEGILDFAANGRLGERLGNRDAAGRVQGCYLSSEPDRWVCMTVGADHDLASLVQLVGEGVWTDNAPPRSLEEAYRRHDEVDEVVANWIGRLEPEEAISRLRSIGLAAGPVNNARDLLFDDHLRSRGFYEVVEHDSGVGRRPIIGRAWKASGFDATIGRAAPSLGEANAYVLHDLLNYSDDEIDELISDELTGELQNVERRPASLSLDDLLKSGRLAEVDENYYGKLTDAYEKMSEVSSEGRS